MFDRQTDSRADRWMHSFIVTRPLHACRMVKTALVIASSTNNLVSLLFVQRSSRKHGTWNYFDLRSHCQFSLDVCFWFIEKQLQAIALASNCTCTAI